MIVKLWASWCKPCGRFAPVFEEARTKINVSCEEWNVDKTEKEWLQSVGVTTIPALLFFKDGDIVRVVTGSDTSVEDIVENAEDIYSE